MNDEILSLLHCRIVGLLGYLNKETLFTTLVGNISSFQVVVALISYDDDNYRHIDFRGFVLKHIENK